jgi:glycosyltransferase involved in cell wall biosynthesis
MHLQAALAAPRRYVQTLGYVLRRKDLDVGYTASSRHACLAQALYLARLLRQKRRMGSPIGHLHAHFAHDPTLIALLAHKLTGISYSFTAHARDLYQIPRSVLIDRIEAASKIVTGCVANVDYFNEVAPEVAPAKVCLLHHGADLEIFHPAPRQTRPADPPLILSTSRLVEKKGFADLLCAYQRLKEAGYRFRGVIYGDGPLRDQLAAQVKELGLEDDVVLAGACTQQELLPVLQNADLFALTPLVTADGDRDGVPAVLVEAMGCGLPVISTSVAGIPELVTHEHDGLLARPRDVAGIASALAALLDDEVKRNRLGLAARQTVVERFDMRAGAQRMATLFNGTTSRELCT